MKITLHQTHHDLADFDGIFSYLEENFPNNYASGLHFFPESFLTGYPLQDCLLQINFINKYKKLINDINNWSKSLSSTKNLDLFFGGIEYHFDDENLPVNIHNVVYQLTPGSDLKVVAIKQLLPNYDIYDEQKYFTAGENTSVINVQGFKIGALICEDMWTSSAYDKNPANDLQNWSIQNNEAIDLVVNFSASPWHIGKQEQRITRAQEISKILNAPFAYVNRVGEEDEILFDGSSFILKKDKLLRRAEFFKKDILSIEIDKNTNIACKETLNSKGEHAWESLFDPRVETQSGKLTLKKISDNEMEDILEALCFSIKEYSRKAGTNKFTIALSGGIDSGLVLAILSKAVETPDQIEAIYMPGHFSAGLSYDLCVKICQNLGIKLRNFPIKFIHNILKNQFIDNLGTPLEGLSDENIQSRIRGCLLYGRSNQSKSLVINTSNKSEISVGYSTQYGDSVGAFSILGDLYKSEVFELAKFLNKKYGEIIPEDMISRPPSAELREGQTDEASLPPYDRLDTILEGILSYRLSHEDLIKGGLPEEEVAKTNKLYKISEYKRFQFCPIIKLRSKSYGFGYRIPITRKIY